MFITSFGLGSLFLYIILSSQPILTEIQLISLSCSIAVLFGCIGALLSYVGLFVNGFCFGLILSIVSFLIWEMKDRANGVQTSFWVIIGLVLILGLCCAIITLRFQKLMLILSSSCLAGVCHLLVLDYFLQLSIVLRVIHNALRFESTTTLCIRHWIIVFILPIVMFLSIVIQYSCTGRNYDHRDSWQKGKTTERCLDQSIVRARQILSESTDAAVLLLSSLDRYLSMFNDCSPSRCVQLSVSGEFDCRLSSIWFECIDLELALPFSPQPCTHAYREEEDVDVQKISQSFF